MSLLVEGGSGFRAVAIAEASDVGFDDAGDTFLVLIQGSGNAFCAHPNLLGLAQ